MCLLRTRRDWLKDIHKERLRAHVVVRLDIESLCEFLHDTADLLRARAQIGDSCRNYVAELLYKIDQRLKRHRQRTPQGCRTGLALVQSRL